jgi:hypothetical protein
MPTPLAWADTTQEAKPGNIKFHPKTNTNSQIKTICYSL